MSKGGGKQWQPTPKKLPRMQSHTGRLTGLWFLPKPAFGLNTNNNNNISRTAQLTSRRCILNIYSTNILTEYFKHAAHSPFFFPLCSRGRLFHNAIFFGSCNIHILNTGCAKILKNSGAEELITL